MTESQPQDATSPSETACTFKGFLESQPPNARALIEDLSQKPKGAEFTLVRPLLQLHCDHDLCKGAEPRPFAPTETNTIPMKFGENV